MARGLIALLLLAAACAEAAAPSLQEGSLEAALPAAVWPSDPALVTGVDCPDLDPEIIEQTGVCLAKIDTAAITVEFSVDEFGEATATVRELLFDVALAADDLSSRLAIDLGIEAPVVSCARAVVVVAPELRISCAASRDGDVIELEIALEGDQGEWSVDLGG